MQNEPETDVSNRPIYKLVEINQRSSYQLFVGETWSDELNEFYESCTSYDNKQISIASDSKDIYADLTLFLSAAPVNTTVYIHGNEPFLWKIAKVLKSMGLVEEQIKMFKPTSNQRDLFCVHCYTITPNVSETPAECCNCKLKLEVSDHFSKLHSAYMGYRVNAEDPIDIPKSKELN